MATPLRKPDPDVEIESELADESLKELRTRPWNISFFQAVRLLRRAFPSRGAVGEFVPPANEAVRFQANPSLGFPASEPSAQVRHMPQGWRKCQECRRNGSQKISSPL